MFDISGLEFLALAVLALVVFGPDKLPKVAADVARTLRQLRRMAADAREDVRRELGPELDGLDVDGISLAELNPRTLVRKHVLADLEDAEGADTAEPPGSTRPAPAEPGPTPYDTDAT
ncbi:MAG: sec-independent protein translocase protein TatB [Actinomycetota bacterium]|jgi:sec-independent protein translocase protein TatB|nr:sec-independent protein translocase protein TatB [Actinomycetota bacterium]